MIIVRDDVRNVMIIVYFENKIKNVTISFVRGCNSNIQHYVALIITTD